MVSLSDTQLAAVMDAARTVPVEKRSIYLQRIAARLALRGRGRFTDGDVSDVGADRLGTPTGGSELLAAAPAIQNNNPDHGCDHQRAATLAMIQSLADLVMRTI
jgi:hypothetical protein